MSDVIGLLLLMVSDNGTGFPVEILSRAFEPYMTTKNHGTGLGLAIVKKIIEEHKGTIKIENADAQSAGHTGAIVTLSLPIKSTQIASKRKSSSKAEQA